MDIVKELHNKELELVQIREEINILKNDIFDLKIRITKNEEKIHNIDSYLLEIKTKLNKIDNLEIELTRINGELVKINSGKLAEDITKTLIDNQIKQSSSILFNWKILVYIILIMFSSFLGVNIDKIIGLMK